MVKLRLRVYDGMWWNSPSLQALASAGFDASRESPARAADRPTMNHCVGSVGILASLGVGRARKQTTGVIVGHRNYKPHSDFPGAFNTLTEIHGAHHGLFFYVQVQRWQLVLLG